MQKYRLRVIDLTLLATLCLSTWAHAEPWRFAVVTDTHMPTGQSIMTEVRNALLAESPDFVLVAGDLTENGSITALQQWRDVFMAPLETAGIDVYPCRGNHDAGSPAAWASVFAGDYALPQNGPDGEKDLTYSFEHKNVFVAAVDQFMAFPWGGMNEEWLRNQLAATRQPHAFVFGHYPVESMQHYEFYSRNGVEARFAGHWHCFVHFEADLLSIEHELHEYVCGVTGGVLATDTWAGPENQNESVVSHAAGRGYLLVEIDGYEATTVYKKRVAPGVYEEAVPRYTHSRAYLFAPNARFDADAQWGGGDLDVAFFDRSTCPDGTLSAWLWDFGDGTTSTEQHPVHTYAAPGMYEVALTATNEYGSAMARQVVFTGGQEVPATEDASLVAAIVMIAAAFAADCFRIRNERMPLRR